MYQQLYGPKGSVIFDHPYNGGSARDYQGASRTVGNPGHGHPDTGEVVFLCIASARVNLLLPRSARPDPVGGRPLPWAGRGTGERGPMRQGKHSAR